MSPPERTETARPAEGPVPGESPGRGTEDPGTRGPRIEGHRAEDRAGVVVDRYDALLVDLDGVVYRGNHAIPGAGAVIRKVRGGGVPVLFLTNNSARTPGQVAERLTRLGVPADPGEILTSSLATASFLRRRGYAGKRAFVIGERGLREALAGAGIEILEGEPDGAELVVIGWDRSLDYGKLRTAAVLVQRGAALVATNGDASYPAADGLVWPGAGAILAAVTATTGTRPEAVVGKPARPLFEAAADMTGSRRPLVVGDRLDTDIAGAAGMGWDSLWVRSGAHGPPHLLRAEVLPTYTGPDLGALLRPIPPASFRPARPEDVSSLVEVLEAAGLSHDGLRDRVETTLVCSGDGGVAATACIEGTERALLRSVAVRLDLRGSGLGLLAVASAVALARERGARDLFLFTEAAGGFFARLGFEEVRRDTLPDVILETAQASGDCPVSARAMRLVL